jgi:O-antigen/teichoic acid export membrane protein
MTPPDGLTAVPVHERRSLSLVQTIASLGAIQVAAMCFQLGRAKVAAVTLGPDGVGVISLIDQVAGLVAQICTFSLPFAALKFLSAAHSEGKSAFASLYVAFLRLLLTVSLAGAACGIALLIWWPGVLGNDLSGYTEIGVLALLAVPGMNLVALLTNSMAAAQRAHAAAAYGAYNAAATAVLCTLGVLLDGLRGYYLGTLITLAVLVPVGLWYLYRREELSIFSHRVSLWRELRHRPDVISFATSLYLISFAMPVVYLIARYAVLNSKGLEATGLLQSAMALSLALTMVMRQANMFYLTPVMNRVGEAEEKFRAAAEYLRAFSLVIAMAAVPIVLFPDWWLPLLYSSRFLAAAPYVYLFVLAQTLELLAGVLLALLIGLGHIATQLWLTLSGLAGLAFIAGALAPRYGIAGVGLGILFDGMVVFVLAAWRLWVLHRIPIVRAVGWLPAGVIVLIASCGIFAVQFPSNTLPSILVKGSICLFLALAGLKILRDKDGSFARR